jgi:hypothetical protein
MDLFFDVRRVKVFIRLLAKELQRVSALFTLPGIYPNVASLLNLETNIFERRSLESVFHPQAVFLISYSCPQLWKIRYLVQDLPIFRPWNQARTVRHSIHAYAHNRTDRVRILVKSMVDEACITRLAYY